MGTRKKGIPQNQGVLQQQVESSAKCDFGLFFRNMYKCITKLHSPFFCYKKTLMRMQRMMLSNLTVTHLVSV